jgi:hypothetical protein
VPLEVTPRWRPPRSPTHLRVLGMRDLAARIALTEDLERL